MFLVFYGYRIYIHGMDMSRGKKNYKTKMCQTKSKPIQLSIHLISFSYNQTHFSVYFLSFSLSYSSL